MEWGTLASLTALDLSRNQLHGWLPAAVLEGWGDRNGASAFGLRSLSLHHNHLLGPLPDALRSLKVTAIFFLKLNEGFLFSLFRPGL